MKKSKLGFTLIEVSLFLAISGLLFFAITLGVQNSIYQQRKNDSVQSFIEFLRGAYDEVLNVQNDATTGGKSDNAIYGKLIVFGENVNLAGGQAEKNEIFTYSVVGKIGDVESGRTLKMLKDLEANVVSQTDEGKTLAGFASSYEPKWSAEVETTDKQQFKGMLLIVRHPTSGAVNTYFNNNVIQINEAIQTGTVSILSDSNIDGYQIRDVDFCINTEPGNSNALRSDIRLMANARNASGVELMTDEESLCK